MVKIKTKYGEIKGITSFEKYSSDQLAWCTLNEKNEICILGQKLVPIYEDETGRRKSLPCLKFYETGEIKGISLQQNTRIFTSIGFINTEKIMFYQSGEIKRIFPLDGKISGYWSEEDEYKLGEKYRIQLEFGIIEAKLISLYFYETGSLKSLTLWPDDKVRVHIGTKSIMIRIGVALYESGKLKSCEPSNPVNIETPIGIIEAYDINAIGIHGEKNSLEFYEDGSIKTLITSTSCIEIYTKENELANKFSPYKIKSQIIDLYDQHINIKIEFKGNYVIFNGKYKYELDEFYFKIHTKWQRYLI